MRQSWYVVSNSRALCLQVCDLQVSRGFLTGHFLLRASEFLSRSRGAPNPQRTESTFPSLLSFFLGNGMSHCDCSSNDDRMTARFLSVSADEEVSRFFSSDPAEPEFPKSTTLVFAGTRRVPLVGLVARSHEMSEDGPS